MTISMNDDHIGSIAQLREFVKLSNSAKFTSVNRDEAYEWIGRILGKFRYFSERKKHRSSIKQYLVTATGYSETQVDRLIRRKKETGRVALRERTQPTFPRVYTVDDIHVINNDEGHAFDEERCDTLPPLVIAMGRTGYSGRMASPNNLPSSPKRRSLKSENFG